MSDVTQILSAIEHGDADATGLLLPAVYQELRILARRQMRQERGNHTLQATALVHEAYLRLIGNECPSWASRNRFFAAASEAMRRILIEHARKRKALRHGGGRAQSALPDDACIPIVAAGTPEDLLDLSAAIDELVLEDPTKAELVKRIYFAGLSLEEAATSLGISRATAHRHWNFARAWLHAKLRGKNTEH